MKRNKYLLMSLLLGASLMTACGETKKDEVSNAVVSTDSAAIVEETAPLEEKVEEVIAEEETEPKVYFSVKSGFYESPFELELRCPVDNAVIYYTTDGTTPNELSNKYEEPITLKDKTPDNNNLSARKDHQVGCTYAPQDKVTKANIIRAVACFEDGTISEISNGTFFVGVDREAHYAQVPVISIITDEANLYDYETGIYVLGKTYEEWLKEDPVHSEYADWQTVGNYSNKGMEWERPVSFEYIGGEGVDNYSADLGIRIKGASTRGYYQKSLKLIARSEYGTKNVKFDLIPGNERSDGTGALTKYKSFVLRNGGNDNGFAKLRDPLIQSFVVNRDFETQQSTPCVVFINGEYFGLYAITEDYTDNYFENNYDIEASNIVVVKCGELDEGQEEDFALFENTYEFIAKNDMSVASNYEEAEKLLDMQSFCEFFALQLYIYNQDSVLDNNNWAMWRVREADNATSSSDGAWRMMVYDTEYSSGVYNEGKTFDTNNFAKLVEFNPADHEDIYYPMEMFLSLYKNDEFKKLFFNSLCDMRNYDFEKGYTMAATNEMAVDYKKLAKESILRNGPDWVALWQNPDEYYKKKISEVNMFFSGRYMQYLKIVQKYLGLENMMSVEITVNDAEAGTVKINNTVLDLSRFSKNVFTGDYFTEYEITIEACPYEGHEFVSWEIKGSDAEDSSAAVTSIKLKDITKIKAIYK